MTIPIRFKLLNYDQIALMWLDEFCLFIEKIYQRAKLEFDNRIWQRHQRIKFYNQVHLANSSKKIFEYLVLGGSLFYELALKLPLVSHLSLLQQSNNPPEWLDINYAIPSKEEELLHQEEELTPKEEKLPHQEETAENKLVIPNNATLTLEHYQELLNSAIDPELAAINCISLGGNSAFERITANIDFDRRNDGRIRDSDLRKFRYLESGGLWFPSLDIETGEESKFGALKPDTPRIDQRNNKTFKYENPHNAPVKLFFFRVSPAIWKRISERYGVNLPENYQELPPEAFWQWVRDNSTSIPIILTEGPKKTLSILSQGYVAIGFVGVYGGYRNPKDEDGEPLGDPYLIPELKSFTVMGRKIIFAFDQDEKRTTIKSVNNAIRKTAKLLNKCGCQVSVMTWHNQDGKGIDDVIFNGFDFDAIYRNAKNLGEWEVLQSRFLIKYQPKLLLNQRYLGDILLPKEKCIVIKSAKNTGKTEQFFIWTDLLIRSGVKRVLIISHRINLGIELSNRLGLPHISGIKDTPEGCHFGLALNIDSLHPKSQAKFNPDEWKGAYIILDELVQLIKHLLNSSTCKQYRVSIIKTFKQLLQTVVQTGGKILCADADLNDIAISFIKDSAGLSDDDIFLIENTYKFEDKWDIHTFDGNDPAIIVKELDHQLEQGKKIFLCLSAQKKKSRWSSQNLEARYRKKFPHLRILRIDSKSIADKNHPAFGCVSKLNEIVTQYDLVITTPTIETGVNITVKHFDAVFGIFQGVQTVDSVRQHLSRYRPTVPRYLWTKKVGINRIGNGATNVKQLLSSEHSKDKANRNRLLECDFEESLNGDFEPLILYTWAQLAAIDNYGMWNYQSEIFEGLSNEGHNLIAFQNNYDQSEIKSLQAEINDNRNEQYASHRADVAAAQSVTDEKFNELDKQHSKTETEYLEYEKGKLERKYLVPITPEIVALDDNGWSQKIHLDYFQGVGKDFLPDREKSVMSSALSNGDGDYFKPDTNKTLIGNKIDLLNVLNIRELMVLEEVSNTHPALIEFNQKCEFYKYQIKEELKIDITKKGCLTAIQRYQHIIALIGYKIPPLSRKGARGQQIWIYGTAATDFIRDENGKILIVNGKAIPIPDGREEVFGAWLERDKKARDKKIEAKLEVEQINQVNQFGSSPPIDDPIFGDVELIREFVAAADWGSTHVHLAKFDEVSQKRILQQLTTEERKILDSLNPLDEEETKAKEIIDIIKSGKDVRVRCDRALEGVENRQNLAYYLHPNYHYLLFPKSQDLVA